MMFDAGKLTICSLENVAAKGNMPKEALVRGKEHLFASRTIGYGRQYAAKGADEQIDLLARIWREPEARVGKYALIEDSEYEGQYRIDNVQHLLDGDNLKVTDLTLFRLEDRFDIAE